MKNPRKPPSHCPICKARILPIPPWGTNYIGDLNTSIYFEYACFNVFSGFDDNCPHYEYKPYLLEWTNGFDLISEIIYIYPYKILVNKYGHHKIYIGNKVANYYEWKLISNRSFINTKCIINKFKQFRQTKNKKENHE